LRKIKFWKSLIQDGFCPFTFNLSLLLDTVVVENGQVTARLRIKRSEWLTYLLVYCRDEWKAFVVVFFVSELGKKIRKIIIAGIGIRSIRKKILQKRI